MIRLLLGLLTSSLLFAQWDVVAYPCPALPKTHPAADFGSERITPPQVISKVEPQYTEQAQQARIAPRQVILKLVIAPDGKPCDFRLISPAGLGLDQSAIHAVSQWKFKPAARAGQPVPVSVHVEVRFAYEGQYVSRNEEQRTRFNLIVSRLSSATEASKPQILRDLARLADKNYPPAQAVYGLMLLEGENVPQEIPAGLRLVQESDKANSPLGIFALGVAYHKGLGVASDPALAAKQFQQAAISGVPEAMLYLGNASANGQGVDRDPEAAQNYYRRCAVFGKAACVYNLAVELSKEEEGEVRTVQALAWALKAEAMGFPLAKSLVQKLDGAHRSEAAKLMRELPTNHTALY